ncbi:UNKNOWN [Stylonychia lemnae]|uniref:MACPF-like domain-containing protein n=1 Tax=Stylonychia lemnae TaxID=5949 RepID=A0A078B187_STYLE|nr:UNKNOWN [Stylonychia lemnae]|eukprot:CDW88319.1 UNKNOWN [Stylonychia lemnae]
MQATDVKVKIVFADSSFVMVKVPYHTTLSDLRKNSNLNPQNELDGLQFSHDGKTAFRISGEGITLEDIGFKQGDSLYMMGDAKPQPSAISSVIIIFEDSTSRKLSDLNPSTTLGDIRTILTTNSKLSLDDKLFSVDNAIKFSRDGEDILLSQTGLTNGGSIYVLGPQSKPSMPLGDVILKDPTLKDPNLRQVDPRLSQSTLDINLRPPPGTSDFTFKRVQVTQDDVIALINGAYYVYGRVVTKDNFKVAQKPLFKTGLAPQINNTQWYDTNQESQIVTEVQHTFTSHRSFMQGVTEAQLSVVIPEIASASSKFKTSSSTSTDTVDETIWATGNYLFPLINVRLNELGRQVSEEFRSFFNNKEINKTSIELFFDTYGHIVPTEMKFGGKLTTYEKQSFSSQVQEEEKSASISVGLLANVKQYMTKIEASLSNASASLATSNQQEQSFSTNLICEGGDIGAIYMPYQWLMSLRQGTTFWQMIAISDFKPIQDFLEPSIKKKIDQYNEKNRNAARIVEQQEQNEIDNWNRSMKANFAKIVKHNLANTARSVICLLTNTTKQEFEYVSIKVLHGVIDRFVSDLGYQFKAPQTLLPGRSYVFEAGSSGFMTGCECEWVYKNKKSGKLLIIYFERSYRGNAYAEFKYGTEKRNLVEDKSSTSTNMSGIHDIK